MSTEIAESRLAVREKIFKLQDVLLALPTTLTMTDKQADDELVTHYFAPGVYVRQIFMPKDMVVVGKIHKTRHVSIISCGHVTVVTERGEQDIRGPYTFINEPGEKRALYVHEDTIWTTIHPTDETDLEKIEDIVIAKNYDDPILLEQLKSEGEIQ